MKAYKKTYLLHVYDNEGGEVVFYRDYSKDASHKELLLWAESILENIKRPVYSARVEHLHGAHIMWVVTAANNYLYLGED